MLPELRVPGPRVSEGEPLHVPDAGAVLLDLGRLRLLLSAPPPLSSPLPSDALAAAARSSVPVPLKSSAPRLSYLPMPWPPLPVPLLSLTIGCADTADEECVPGGPAFSYTYYTTFTSVVGGIFSLVGVALFQRTMSTWNFRPVFWVTSAVNDGNPCCLLALIMVRRQALRCGAGR